MREESDPRGRRGEEEEAEAGYQHHAAQKQKRSSDLPGFHRTQSNPGLADPSLGSTVQKATDAVFRGSGVPPHPKATPIPYADPSLGSTVQKATDAVFRSTRVLPHPKQPGFMIPGVDRNWVRIPEGSREKKKMHDHFPTPDPSIREYVLRVKKADEMRGELIGQALIFEAELNAWYDKLEEKEDAENGC